MNTRKQHKRSHYTPLTSKVFPRSLTGQCCKTRNQLTNATFNEIRHTHALQNTNIGILMHPKHTLVNHTCRIVLEPFGLNLIDCPRSL